MATLLLYYVIYFHSVSENLVIIISNIKSVYFITQKCSLVLNASSFSNHCLQNITRCVNYLLLIWINRYVGGLTVREGPVSLLGGAWNAESDILREKLREGRIFSALAIDLFHNNFSSSGSPPELRKLAHEL